MSSDGGPAAASLQDKRFLIAGLSRLTVRVGGLLAERGADVTVFAPEEHDGGPGAERRLLARLPPGTHVISNDDLEDALSQTDLGGVECLLALADDDLVNLAAAVTSHALDPNVPIVVRAYDITLADQLEKGLNIRRAYSVSILSAPAFLAAGLGSKVLETLRLGDSQVPVWELPVTAGSPLEGKRPSEAGPAAGAQVLARASRDTGAWRAPAPDGPLQAGDHVVVGGPSDAVVRLALAENGVFGRPGDGPRRRPWRASLRERRADRASRPRSSGIAGGTLLPVTAVVLAAFLLLTIVVFAVALHKNPIDAFYFAITTALGNSTLDDNGAGLKVFGVIAMLAGGALLGVLFSYFASVATSVRIEQRMGRQAQRMSGHAVVAGLGTVGYRIGRLLHDSGIPWTAIDREPDERHAEAAGAAAPVLTGDVRLPENLERAGIHEAACLFACTDSDLANIEACMQAKRLNPKIRTVARIFDDALASRVGGTFGIDMPVSATHVAAAAFVGAAVDERALRPFQIGQVEYVAFRRDVTEPLSAERLGALQNDGVLVLARRRPDGTVGPGGAEAGLTSGETIVVAGPRGAVEASILAP